jgi:hypothetical protein
LHRIKNKRYSRTSATGRISGSGRAAATGKSPFEPGFARNERLSRFLRFVVERHLEGRDEELKESLIAIEVFGRPLGYDSKKDPIVRTEASRLRARLSEYYLGEGKDDPLAIELPKGGSISGVGGQARSGRTFTAQACTGDPCRRGGRGRESTGRRCATAGRPAESSVTRCNRLQVPFPPRARSAACL